MAQTDPNLEWLGHVQPTGLVVAPAVLSRYGLLPEEQLRADGDAVAEFLSTDSEAPALSDPWSFFAGILGWQPAFVAAAPGGPALPEDLFAQIPESDTVLTPTWAVSEPDGGWQILVRIEDPGVDPEKRKALQGWEATPHQRLERLLRETGIPIGLLVTDKHIRLIYAPRGETSGWLAFPIRDLATVGGRPMLGALKLLLNTYRLFSDGKDRRLPGLLRASRVAQAEVSAKLATQVLGALHELLRGLHAADQSCIEGLAKQRSTHLYEGLLTVLLRLIFLLYAEDRALIPSREDGMAVSLYHEGYGVRSLHAKLLADKARHPDTMEERHGAWSRLLALFRLVHSGDGSGWIRGRGGKLFDSSSFPFLEGRDNAAAPPSPARVTDGCVLRILDGLLVLDGERLSYRTLDVEQIGSVYETVMGFTVQAMSGPALAIRAGKNNRTPVFVNLKELADKKGKDREKYLKEETDRGQFPAKVSAAIATAGDAAALAEALRAVVDERGSPGGQVAQVGMPLLQPTDERRRTGSHYTPRSLTEPIVCHALEPAFARIGPEATPEAVLTLKICDPAMGSGAFLVEACRQLAARLVMAWNKHSGTRPVLAADEDEELLARRLVAQRCLYGVDRNPMATDLARLSLWLATLARDHEFTFLDHALKSGDSLVGLTRNQIAALTWGDDRQTSTLGLFVRRHVKDAVRARAEIREAPDDVQRAEQETRHNALECRMAELRALGDAVLACFFGHEKPKAREAARRSLAATPGESDAMWAEARRLAAPLRQGQHPVTPFHWELEFPEVFEGAQSGFDAIVGNPPFLGGKRISTGLGDHYALWLQTLHKDAQGNADLVAHFFRRAFALLRPEGCFGLIATKTIGQGDTREGGLRAVLNAGGSISRAVRRLSWPGEADVVVSVVHVRRGAAAQPVLNGQPVRRISAYLVEGDLDASPERLAANTAKSFIGMYLLGLGFTFDAAAKGNASTVAEMHRLIEKDSRNAERIFPYLGSDEVNSSPIHAHRRWCIDFNDFPLRREATKKTWAAMAEHERAECRRIGIVPPDYLAPVAADWPDLLSILEVRVKDDASVTSKAAKDRQWWQFWRPRPELRSALQGAGTVLVTGAAAVMHHMFAFAHPQSVYSHKVVVFCLDNVGAFSVMQSAVHELWSREFGTTFGSVDALTYNPSRVFQTFPFPKLSPVALETTAIAYRDYRAALMTARNEGMTKTYNHFHNDAARSPDITRLRELHHEMDVAVLRAYGWDDLADRAAPEFLNEDNELDHRYLGRLFWPASFRDEMLARLLNLNRERAAEERRLGLSPAAAPDEEEEVT